jgi:predicted ABC-class ATPase
MNIKDLKKKYEQTRKLVTQHESMLTDYEVRVNRAISAPIAEKKFEIDTVKVIANKLDALEKSIRVNIKKLETEVSNL